MKPVIHYLIDIVSRRPILMCDKRGQVYTNNPSLATCKFCRKKIDAPLKL